MNETESGIIQYPKEAFGEPTGRFPVTYSEEASTLGLKAGYFPNRFEIEGVGTFIFSHYDRDASGEDIAGANYRHEKKNIKALIIND